MPTRFTLKSRKEIAWILKRNGITGLDIVILVVVVLIGFINLPRPFMGDQALNAVITKKMSQGEVLYRDIWDIRQPGFLFSFSSPERYLASTKLVFTHSICSCPLSRANRTSYLSIGVTAGYLARMKSRHAVLLAIVLGINHALIAFENLTLNCFGKWQFKRGWRIFDGDYLREYFYADVRLLVLCALFCLVGALLFQSQVRPFWRRMLDRVRVTLLPRSQP